MDKQSHFSNLRNSFAKFYQDESSQRRIADDAGLNLANITFSGQTANNWHNILKEAEKQDKIDDLLDAVLEEEEYGNSPKLLRDLLRIFRESHKKLSQQRDEVKQELARSQEKLKRTQEQHQFQLSELEQKLIKSQEELKQAEAQIQTEIGRRQRWMLFITTTWVSAMFITIWLFNVYQEQAALLTSIRATATEFAIEVAASSSTPTPTPSLPVPTDTSTQVIEVIPPSLTPSPVNTLTPTPDLTSTPTITATITMTPSLIGPCTSSSLIITSTVDHAPMVCIPAGKFTRGNNNGNADEQPEAQIDLAEFYIDQYEVTNRFYRECVEAGKCNSPQKLDSITSISNEDRKEYYTNMNDYGDFPVIWVTWEQASDYCEFRGKRLPTEAEWEKAARGQQRSIYPWGNKWTESIASIFAQRRDTAQVGSNFEDKSDYQVYDMAGNVREWVNDFYGRKYYSENQLQNPPGPEAGSLRVVRGGAWGTKPSDFSASKRQNSPTTNYAHDRGFRCAADAPLKLIGKK